MTFAQSTNHETTGPSRHSIVAELCIIKLYYIFTFYYICAVVRATDTTCRITDVYYRNTGSIHSTHRYVRDLHSDLSSAMGKQISDIYHMSSPRPTPRNGDPRLQYPWRCLCGKEPSPPCYSESSVEYGTMVPS